MSEIDCSPDIDPFCSPCFLDRSFCDPFPGGSGGGFSGGGSREPRPRAFSWPLLPPAFFGTSGDQAVPKKPQDCRQACEQCLDAVNESSCISESLTFFGNCIADCDEECPGPENIFSGSGRRCFHRTVQRRRDALLSCPLAPRTGSYDTRIARHDLEHGPD